MPINLPALSPTAIRAFNGPRWRRWLVLWARRSLYPVSILAGILYQFLRWPIVLAFVVCVALAITGVVIWYRKRRARVRVRVAELDRSAPMLQPVAIRAKR